MGRRSEVIRMDDLKWLSHHFMANKWGNNGNKERLFWEGSPKSLQMVTAAMKLKDACSLEEKPRPS